MTRIPSAAAFATLLVLFGTGGCGWVDATGRQAGDDAPGIDAVTEVDVPTFAGVAVPLLESIPIALLERSARDVRLTGEDASLDGWTWRALDEAAEPAACASVEGFDPALAERRLSAACSDPERCALQADERLENGETLYRLVLPALRAPVAARVALTTRDRDGHAVERRRTLCGLSVNEAPEAGDDRLSVARGETLVIRAADPRSLLANDSDDDDVRNAPLSIDPTPERAPRHAVAFELGTDGSVLYRAADDLSLGADGVLEDSFSYRLGDGLHEVTGQVVVVITDGNRPPVASGPLPALEIEIDPLVPRPVRMELGPYFDDPDGDPLTFTVAPGSLPPGGTLFVDESGVLGGEAGATDLGSWRVTLIVDDGRSTIERDVRLDIVRAFEGNTVPTVTDIDNRAFSGRFLYDVAPFFDDADGDTLHFTALGLPSGVEIDDSGVITGKSKKQNRGSWFIVVVAADGQGGIVSDGFRLTIL